MIHPGEPNRPLKAHRYAALGVVTSAAAVLLAIVVGVAFAKTMGARPVQARRTYTGTIARSSNNRINGGPSDPIDVSVSANAASATVLANYSPCQETSIYFPEQAFPITRIRNGRFMSIDRITVKPADITITATGRFLRSGRVAGTISSVTVNYLMRPGRICKTSNHWTAQAQPKGLHACVTYDLGDYGVAQDITDERTGCAAVEKALARGTFNPPLLPLARRATLWIPGWICQNKGERTPSFSCKRGKQSFRFVVFS